MKKLIPALCMLLVAAALMGTSTYAWFSMNKQVTATGMQVKAQAEDGIVISNAQAGTYDVTAATTKTTVAQLFPGSTADLETWLHSHSTNLGTANTSQEYTVATEWENNTDRGNYVVHEFYIKSSSGADLTVTSLNVDSVVAKVGDNASVQNLSKALRVGVKFTGSSNTYIYAPVDGYTATVSVQNAAGAYDSSNRTPVEALDFDTQSKDTSVTSIPAAGKKVSVYVWYEGEDEACISNNIVADLETLSIVVTFSYT